MKQRLFIVVFVVLGLSVGLKYAQGQEYNACPCDKLAPGVINIQVSGNQHTGDPHQRATDSSWWEWLVARIRDPVTANTTIAVFTIVLAVVGGLQWWTYRATLKVTKAIERAYIKISHVRDRFAVRPKEEGGECLVTIQIRNSGNTPARVTKKFLACRLYPRPQELPHVPDYGDDGTMEAFLVKGDFFYTSRSFSLSMEELASVMGREPTATLYLVGYVDYIDKFNVPHRVGFARQYDSTSGGLAFTNTSGYNYDREYKEKGLY